MKFYLIVSIFLFFLILAIVVYYRYYLRYKLYGDLLYICKYLKNNISFKKDNLDILMQNTYLNISNVTRRLIKNECNNILLYKKNDIETVRNFLQSLGKGDVDYEINNINFYITEFEEMKNVTRENLHKNGAVYLKVILGLGLCVCIMLI